MRVLLGLFVAALGAAQSPTLVISQVYIYSAFTQDYYSASYVVLFNSGGVPVGLQGLSFQALDSAQQWESLPLSGTLQPGQSFLVEFATTSGYDPRLTPDATWSVNSNTGPLVVAIVPGTTPLPDLWPAASSVIDLFGAQGTAYPFNGQPFSWQAGTVAMFRNKGGCQNTGDNLSDFATALPAPRNLASALAPCSTALPAPTISSVANAATLRPSAVVTGAAMIINGTGFSNGHTAVTFGARPVTIYSVTSNQIIFNAPFAVDGPTSQLQVRVDSAGSATQSVSVAATAPGIFSPQTQLSPGQAPQNQDGSPNSLSSPAQPGSHISVWVTGLDRAGAFAARQPRLDADHGPSSSPPARTPGVSFTIGGIPTTVVGIQEAPGPISGIYRIDAEIPASIPGGLEPMVVSAGGVSGPPQYVFLPAATPVNTAFSLARVGAVDLAYDPFRHVLWASTGSDAPVYDPTNTLPSQPNSILMIDPVSRNLISAIPCNSSAYRIALSVNGRYLWMATVDGSIKRLNLETDLIEFTLQLSALMADAAPSLADLVAGPLVVVMAPSSLDEEALVITFGAPYPILALRGSTRLAFIGPPDTCAVFNNDGTLWTENYLLTITPRGPQVLATVPITSGITVPVVLNVNGPILATDGSLRRNSDLRQLGLLSSGVTIGAGTQGTPAVAYAQESGLVYFSGSICCATNYTVEAFDPIRMVPVGQFYFPYFGAPQTELPNQGPPVRVVSLGPEGLATVFSDPFPGGYGGAIFFTPYSLVQPLPNLSVPSQPANGQMRTFGFAASWAAVDPLSNVVYLSVSSVIPGFGNSVVPLDTTAGNFGQPVWVGSEPSVGVVSADEKYLYVSISGAYSVARFDLPNLVFDAEFPVYNDFVTVNVTTIQGVGTPTSATALLDVPGAPSTTIAVNRGTAAGVAIYDNGVKRSETSNASTSVSFNTDLAQFSPQGDFLLALNNGGQTASFSRWRVTSNGLEFDAAQAGVVGGSALVCFSEQSILCATNFGFLVDPIALDTVRVFGSGILRDTGIVIAVDPANDRMYFLDAGVQGTPLSAFVISTGLAAGSLTLNLNLTDEFPAQMQVLPNGDLLILTNASVRILPASLIH